VRTFLTIVMLALAIPGTAFAVDASHTPTPEQLWNAFPLKPTRAGALPTPTARPALRPQTHATPHAQRHGTSVALLVAIAFPFVLAAGLALTWLRARAAPRPRAAERPPAPTEARPRRFDPNALRPPARPPPPAPPVPVPARRSGVAVAEAAPRVTRFPATADRLWRCVLVWRVPEVLARLLAPGTQWPSSEGAPLATPELTAAVAQLDAELREEGWTPLDPGEGGSGPHDEEWFDRRYVWTHAQPPPGTEGAR
jgi:hypothetical protein